MPSSTEIVCALGLKDELVGRSHECDFPYFVSSLPIVSSPAFDTTGGSSEIDGKVKGKLAHSKPLYKIHESLLESLKADIIITQSHCNVCAVDAAGVSEVLKNNANIKSSIVSLKSNGLDDLWKCITEIAQAARVSKRGAQLVKRLKSRIEKVSVITEDLPHKPTVACIEWLDPLMGAGNWIPELVHLAGGINLFGEAGKQSPVIRWNDVVAKDPDVLLISPCGFNIQKTRDEIQLLTSKKEWYDLKAINNNRVYLLDGNQYFNRPGPRLVDSIEIMAEIFHPSLFHYGHQNEAWEYCGLGGE